MNTDELKKNVGQVFRLQPLPVIVQGYLPEIGTLTSDGPRLRKQVVDADYDWRLENVTSEGVALHCLFTGHKVVLRHQYVREHHAPNTLLLRCRLTLEGDKVLVQPI
jgi:hypothetical protein